MKVQISLIVAIILVVAGCNPNPVNTPETSVATAEVTSATNNNSIISSAMTTYVDKRSDVAFDYPTGWTISVPPTDNQTVSYAITLASYDFIHSNEPRQEGQTQIDIVFHSPSETVASERAALKAQVEAVQR